MKRLFITLIMVGVLLTPLWVYSSGGQIRGPWIINSSGSIVPAVSATAVLMDGTVGVTGDLTASADLIQVGQMQQTTQNVDISFETEFAVTSDVVRLQCPSAENLNTIIGGLNGEMIVIRHDDSNCTIVDDDDPTAANAINLGGAASNSVGATGKILTLIFNGSAWQEVSETTGT